MSQQNQQGATFALRIAETGGTFRCRATAYEQGRDYPRSTFDTTESRSSSIQNVTSAKPRQLARNNRVVAQPSTGAFRIGVSTATFRMAG